MGIMAEGSETIEHENEIPVSKSNGTISNSNSSTTVIINCKNSIGKNGLVKYSLDNPTPPAEDNNNVKNNNLSNISKVDITLYDDESNSNTSTDNTQKVIKVEAEAEDNQNSSTDLSSNRRHSKSSSLPSGVKLCPEGQPNLQGDCAKNGDVDSDSDGTSAKWTALEEELKKAQMELREKDEEVEKLKGIRQQVEEELDDLTASLFQEAHKMVNEAKVKEISSEKSLKEMKMQMEGLQAEVQALKTLLITSTPSRPNLGHNGNGNGHGTPSGNGLSIFTKSHKRTPSHNHLQYGRTENQNGDHKEAKEKCGQQSNGTQNGANTTGDIVIDREFCEIDPFLHGLFASWRKNPSLDKKVGPNEDFISKIYSEDIEPSLCFTNDELRDRLFKAIEDNSIWVEPLPERERVNIPKQCALLLVPRICHFRMRFALDSDEYFDISKFCRDRIAAVCEFLNYLRYIKNGLVKAPVDESYWEIIRLRKQLTFAKLGISIS